MNEDQAAHGFEPDTRRKIRFEHRNYSLVIDRDKVEALAGKKLIIFSENTLPEELRVMYDAYTLGASLQIKDTNGNDLAIIVLVLKNIFPRRKKKSREKLERKVLEVLAHEVRHAKVSEKNKFSGPFRRFLHSFLVFGHRISSRKFPYNILLTLLLFRLSYLVLAFHVVDDVAYWLSQEEREARKFSRQALKNPEWRDCVRIREL